MLLDLSAIGAPDEVVYGLGACVLQGPLDILQATADPFRRLVVLLHGIDDEFLQVSILVDLHALGLRPPSFLICLEIGFLGIVDAPDAIRIDLADNARHAPVQLAGDESPRPFLFQIPFDPLTLVQTKMRELFHDF